MLEFSSTESCTTSNTSTPLVGFSSNDSSCDGNVALMNDFESTEGCNGQGPQGPDGFSAYQIAVFDGFVGTETQWLASLVGPGVPVGGTAGQILAKIDLTNYNTQWINNFALPSLTSGSVLFSDGTTIAQNNANFFWNNANNRLGIGTTTPSYALHVNGVTGATTFTIPSYNSQLNQNYLMLYGGYGAGMQGTYNNPTGGDLTFGTFINSIFNEKMRLLPSGNLGIGTITPTGKLDVVGSLVTARVLTTGSLSLIGTDASASAQTVFTISTGVNNATGPNIILAKARGQANEGLSTSDILGTIQFQGGNGSTLVESARIQSVAASGFSVSSRASSLLFYTTAIGSTTITERMRISSEGNVGIGITTPIYLLDVAGAINSVSGLSATDVAYRINGSGVLGKTTAGNFPSNTGYTRFIGQGMLFSANNDNTVQMVIMPTTGNVGIGTTTPTAKLQVKGDGTNPIARFESSAGNNFFTINNLGQAIFGSVGANEPYLVNYNGTSTESGIGQSLRIRQRANTGATGNTLIQYWADGLFNNTTSGTAISHEFLSSGVACAVGNTIYRNTSFAYTINNTGAQTGTATGIFLNATETALNGMTHRLLDLQVGGVSKFSVINTGQVLVDKTFGIKFMLSSVISAPSNGNILLQNTAGTDFGRLQLGGTTSSFPAIKRNGAGIDFVVADDSAYCNIRTAAISATSIYNNVGAYYMDTFGFVKNVNTNTRLNIFNNGYSIELGASNVVAASAIFELKSTTQGFLPPRMTTAQKVGIATPATGLVVFDTDLGKLCVFAVTWQTITSA